MNHSTHKTQQAVYEAALKILRGEIDSLESTLRESVSEIDEALPKHAQKDAPKGKEEKEVKQDLRSQVQSMKNWIEPLKKLLESSLAPAAKTQFIREYAIWVRSFGSFYRSALKSNPGLAEVFKALEDVFKIQVKLSESIAEADELDATNDQQPAAEDGAEEAEGNDFVGTLKELLEKIPDTALKAKFVYQVERWKRNNQTESSILAKQVPDINELLDSIMGSFSDAQNLE